MTNKNTTSIRIKASRQIIWNILTDIEKYLEWNPFVNPTRIRAHKKTRLKWLGSLWCTGLIDLEHQFELIDLGNGEVYFTQKESMVGMLMGWFRIGSSTTSTRQEFELMNKALKLRAENQMKKHQKIEQEYYNRLMN